jgi:hypothetical protein
MNYRILALLFTLTFLPPNPNGLFAQTSLHQRYSAVDL